MEESDGKRWRFKCLGCGYDGWMTDDIVHEITELGKCPICGSTVFVIKEVSKSNKCRIAEVCNSF